MAKTKEELETLKKEYEKLAANLSELSEEELNDNELKRLLVELLLRMLKVILIV